jgi:tight adherence protein C
VAALLELTTDPTILAPFVIFLVVFALVIALAERKSPAAVRLARHGVPISGTVATSPALRAWRPQLARPALLSRLSSRFHSAKNAAKARELLARAGSPMSLMAYARVQRLMTFVVGPLLAVLVLVSLGQQPLAFGAAAIMLLVVPRLPAFVLKRKGKQRAKAMDVVIADVLDLLVVCVEGGQSLSAALMQISQRMDNIAAEEFSRLLADINSGMSRRDAFHALADRCQSEALAITCTTIVHADKVGMSLAHTLRTLSDMMRTRRRQAAETRARQAPIKMMPVLVGFMLPTLLALLLGPVALEVMQNFK